MTAKPTPLHCVAHDSAHLNHSSVVQAVSGRGTPSLFRTCRCTALANKYEAKEIVPANVFIVHGWWCDYVYWFRSPQVQWQTNGCIHTTQILTSGGEGDQHKHGKKLILIQACVQYFQSLQACFLTWPMCAFNHQSGESKWCSASLSVIHKVHFKGAEPTNFCFSGIDNCTELD